jgi:hypothetical protein
MRGSYNVSDFGLWQGLYDTVTQMLHNLDLFMHGDLDMNASASWFDPIMQQLQRLGQAGNQ